MWDSSVRLQSFFSLTAHFPDSKMARKIGGLGFAVSERSLGIQADGAGAEVGHHHQRTDQRQVFEEGDFFAGIGEEIVEDEGCRN